jgi:hypothetical protein
MKRDRLLVIGVRGPFGAEMTRTLRKLYGALRVVAADRGPADEGRSNEAPASAITVRNGYNINAMSISPGELARTIRKYIPQLQVDYQPDHRDLIAQQLPAIVDDAVAERDWEWEFAFSLPEMVRHMLGQLSSSLNLKPEQVRQMQLPVFF